MGHFPAKFPQGTTTLSNYAVYSTGDITPAVGTFLLCTTTPNIGGFIPTELFAYVSEGPTSPVGLNLAINFSVGYIGPTYDEFIAALVAPAGGYMFGGDGTSPEQAINLVKFKFKQMSLKARSIAGSAAAFALGTPRNAATPIYVRITQIQGTAGTTRIRFILGGIYTGLK